MRLIVLLALVCLFAASVQAASNYTDCSKKGDPAKITELDMSPDPPVRETDEHITLIGTLSETVTGGSAVLSITYSGVPVFNQTWQICSVISCPASGNLKAAITIPASAIPSFAPPGQYTSNTIIVDQNNQELACITAVFTL